MYHQRVIYATYFFFMNYFKEREITFMRGPWHWIIPNNTPQYSFYTDHVARSSQKTIFK